MLFGKSPAATAIAPAATRAYEQPTFTEPTGVALIDSTPPVLKLLRDGVSGSILDFDLKRRKNELIRSKMEPLITATDEVLRRLQDVRLKEDIVVKFMLKGDISGDYTYILSLYTTKVWVLSRSWYGNAPQNLGPVKSPCILGLLGEHFDEETFDEDIKAVIPKIGRQVGEYMLRHGVIPPVFDLR